MEKLVIPNKKGGVVTGTIWGIGGLVIGVILILVVVSTLHDSNLITDQTQSWVVTNETVNNANTGIVTLANSPATRLYFTGWNNSVVVLNNSPYPVTPTYETLVEGTHYVVNSSTGQIINKTATYNSTLITYTWTESITHLNTAVDNFTSNFTDGINNVSEKIPTILLIVAVVFLLGALALLVRYAQGMGIGAGGGSL